MNGLKMFSVYFIIFISINDVFKQNELFNFIHDQNVQPQYD